MDIVKLFDVHQFMHSHELEPILDSKRYSACKHCHMVFDQPALSYWGKPSAPAPILSTIIIDADAAGVVIKHLPDDIMLYEQSYSSTCALIWFALKTGDPNGVYRQKLLDAYAKGSTNNVDIELGLYAKHVRRDAELDNTAAKFLSASVHKSIQYCILVDEPVTAIKNLLQPPCRKYFYQSFEAPYYTKRIRKAEEVRDKLWPRVTAGFRNTRLFNSSEYKAVAQQHIECVNFIKQLKQTRVAAGANI
jgi:hypothetical protein